MACRAVARRRDCNPVHHHGHGRFHHPHRHHHHFRPIPVPVFVPTYIPRERTYAVVTSPAMTPATVISSAALLAAMGIACLALGIALLSPAFISLGIIFLLASLCCITAACK